jgi:hypothetical protein
MPYRSARTTEPLPEFRQSISQNRSIATHGRVRQRTKWRAADSRKRIAARYRRHDALRLDIDDMMRWGGIRVGSHLGGEMRFNFYDDEIDVKFESRLGDPGDSWLRLQYVVHDYWSGEACEIDDKIFLATSRPPFGGLRWWFVCPRENRRVRKLYLPVGGRHFWSRHAYELAYASQRETKFDRALRRARKLRLRLGGDPADDECPDKPPRMRWATYNRLMDKLVAADDVADERLILLAARWLER